MAEPVSLSRIFLDRLGGRRADELAPSAESLEASLLALDAAGRAAWPDVSLAPEAFAAHVADCVRGTSDAADAISTLHAADLFLACACSCGVAAALIVFDRSQISRVPGLVRRFDSSSAFADDVAQSIREMFLIPTKGGRSRMAEYSGRGALANWFRIIAVRAALRLRRERRAGVFEDDEREPQDAGAADPELDYLKFRYRSVYEEALRNALASLPDRDALLLKLHYLDGLSIDRIGALYGIHRSTVARWRSNIRRRILASTREQLQRQLSLTESEFDSLLGLVRSQLVLSLRSALRRPAAVPRPG